VRAKLTKQVVDRTRAGSTNVFVWDRELPGFGLKVTPAHRKVFVFQYRQRSSPRRVTLGRYGPLTVDEARSAARRLAGRVAAGEDPAGERAEARADAKEATVANLSEAYLDELAARARPVSVYEYRRVFARYIIPALGSKSVASLTLRDVSALHMAYRKRPVMANRTVTALRAFLNWCERRGYTPRDSNPCSDVDRFPERARERFLSPAEIARLGAALTKAEREGLPPAPQLRKKPRSNATAKHRPRSVAPIPANPFAVAAIRFLACSGWREQEALTLRWQDLDVQRGEATLGTTKTGRSQRRLGPPAIALLTSLPRLDNSPYVFPGRERNRPLRELKRVWTAVRHAAGLDDVRLHDLRHSFASFAVGSGLSLYLTGQLLGHKQAATTQRYAHFADDVLRSAADDVSSVVWAAMMGEQSTQVLPLRTKRAR
jgi:integrase